MLLKEIEKALKQRSQIRFFNAPDYMWLGNGEAWYPVEDLPFLEAEELYYILNIPEDKRGKFTIEAASSKLDIFRDNDDAEELPGRVFYDMTIKDTIYRPMKTSTGIIFVDVSYLRPFKKTDYEIRIRLNENGNPYIAIKEGMFLKGIIVPVTKVDEKFVSDLYELADLSAVRVDNSEQQDSLFDGENN